MMLADCLISPLKEIGKCILTQCLWPPIKSHFDYWWCFHSNIQGLRDGIEELKRKKHSIEQEIEGARLRLEVVRPEVEEWLKASTDKLDEARKILLPDDNTPEAWKLISRYSQGKNAKETAEEIANHLNNGKFDLIADHVPPLAMASPSQTSTTDFESRKGIEEDIIKSLKESSVDVIGICGMGGVGKTTMAERIRERVKKENLFDEVVMVTVSQQKEMLEIQGEIAEWLKLELAEKFMEIRAAKLRTRLMDRKRKIIIFDDVWNSFKLKDLGVPQSCKILLTTRYKDVCEEMEAQKIIAMETLTEEEAWILFEEKVGVCLKGSTLYDVAKGIVSECKCLPIALVIVGKFLQNKEISIWKDSLKKLREPDKAYFGQVEEHVYKSLKLSYDHLDCDSQRYLFLLCCLFPEDYDIRVDQLIWHIMGLQGFPLFDDINNINEARNRTNNLVEKLKSRFLLIDGGDKLHVKMHDVVRDVAIYIGSKEEKGFLKSLSSIKNSSDDNCNWMSVNISSERMEVPVVLRFPKLRLLMLLKWGSNELSHISFDGMKDLNVLSFQSTWVGLLPPTLGSLKYLQTLCLVNCEVENISVVGELTSLKIFSCYRCENISELPAEIRRLKDLRLLELNGCRKLQRISFGIISSLVGLEELKIRGSFSEWEAEEKGKERRNASLTELGSLPNLSCLEIEIDDCTLSAQQICLSQNLVKYYIRIGSIHYYHDEGRDNEKVMILNLPSDIGAVGKWIQKGVRNTEGLYLKGDGSGSNNFNIAESEYLMNLTVHKCSTLKKLVETKDCKFHNLKSIQIKSCPKLISLFSVSVARRCLLQLEDLHIEKCDKLEVVFWNDDNTDGCIEFPKLNKLTLWNLRNLTAFCQGLENIIIKFPNLTLMSIGGLRKLNSLFPLNSETVDDHHHTTSSLHLFCNPKDVYFCNLKSIHISGCHNLRSLFSVSVARRCLLQLEVLDIKYCDKLEVVFWNEGTDDNTDGCIEFPKLKQLTLQHVPNLTAFCNPKDVSFCNLKSISIYRCHNLRYLFSVSVARRGLLQLEDLRIEKCDKLEVVFWNEGTDDNTDGCIEFPKLKELTLWNLPNLTAFCQGLENIIIKFPNLTEMKFVRLPKLNSLFPVHSETVDDHHHTTSSLHLFCNPKVEMSCLKDLTLSSFQDNIGNIWCHQIPNNVFKNLERLSVSYVNGIRSLMSTSIAKNLVNLKSLNIMDCEEMVEVIERDDDDKQVVDINRLFPTLRELNMWSLDKLRWFWQWNLALELSLLEEVNIIDCPVMETFTLGSINTPKIRKIDVNLKKIDDQKDLNDLIRHIWTESQDTSKTEKEKDEHEDGDWN